MPPLPPMTESTRDAEIFAQMMKDFKVDPSKFEGMEEFAKGGMPGGCCGGAGESHDNHHGHDHGNGHGEQDEMIKKMV